VAKSYKKIDQGNAAWPVSHTNVAINDDNLKSGE